MTEQKLSQPPDPANGTAHEGVCSDASGKALSPRKAFRDAQQPKFIQLPYRVIRDKRLRGISRYVFALLIYNSKYEGAVSCGRMAQWLRVARSTVSRALTYLRKLCLVDAMDRVVPDWRTRLDNTVQGHINIGFDEIADLKSVKAAFRSLMMKHLFTMPYVAPAVSTRFEVTAGDFGRFIGHTEKTARTWMKHFAGTLFDADFSKGHAARLKPFDWREREAAKEKAKRGRTHTPWWKAKPKAPEQIAKEAAAAAKRPRLHPPAVVADRDLKPANVPDPDYGARALELFKAHAAERERKAQAEAAERAKEKAAEEERWRLERERIQAEYARQRAGPPK
jgi:hypothetical protein